VRWFSYNLVVRSQHGPLEDRRRQSGRMNDPKREQFSVSATSVLTATADFHHLGSFGFLAIFTTVFAVFLGRTITCSMRTFAGIMLAIAAAP